MIDPITLFEGLDKSNSEIKKLRKAQIEIIKKYYEDYKEEKRIGLKLPTGSGKSLIAILILEAWRRVGNIVAILCANQGLAEDMKRRCDELEIPSETIFGAGSDPDPKYQRDRFRNLLRYQRKQIIGIFNYHSFLYGIESPSSKITIPDILVIDDASDFETIRNEFYSIKISSYKDKHKNAYNAVLNKLSEYHPLYPSILEFKNRTSNQHDVELVLYPHQQEIISIIRNYWSELKEDTDFFFSYQRNREYLNSYLIFVSQEEIEIRPLVFPEELSSFNAIKQIIFMSATLPDEELLHKIFGISKTRILMLDENLLSEEAYNEIETMGKRLIFPIGQGPKYYYVDAQGLDAILELTKIHRKSLVLVNSFRHARQIQTYLEQNEIPFVLYRRSEDCYDFAYKMSEGALLCANRYFGLDFPGDTCSLGIIVRLPVIWDVLDAFQLTVLKNAHYIEQRIGNRLTQALGRCNRLIEDEAIYYILDSRIIARLVGNPEYLRYLPRNIFAEMMAGYLLSMGEIDEAIKYGKDSFFGKEDEQREEFIEEEKKYWSPPTSMIFTSKYDVEIEAWSKSIAGAYSEAGNLFDFVASFFEEHIEKYPQQKLNLLAAWNYYLSSLNYYNAYSHYKNLKDKENCLLSLKKSIELGENSSWFNQLRGIYNELVDEDEKKLIFDVPSFEARRIKEQIALEFDDFISSNTSKRRDWKQAFSEIRANIDHGTHGQCLVALETILELLGYKVKRGNNQLGEPDLIALSSQTVQRYQLAIEIKTLGDGAEEGVDSVREVMGDASIIRRTRPDYETIPILITQKEDFSSKAIETAKATVRLFPVRVLQRILEKLFKKLDTWNNLDSNQKWYFIDNLISPLELYDVFSLKPDPIIQTEEVDRL